MKGIIKTLAAAALLAVMCSGAWAADIAVKDGLREWTNGNNYTVTGSVRMGDRIEVKGSVTLTLNDGCELNASGGIHVPGGSSLTIKTPSGPAGSGKLMADLRNETWGKAAIGGNRDGSTGTIRIEGGYITVRGGYASAGIGGAPGCGNGTIIITGGTINAQGQSDGAGIGGGERGDGGTIRIEGGKINAIGGMMAAGIGGGQHKNGGSITITDGEIYAQGGEWAAGIGGGEGTGGGDGGNGGDINISGGKVIARGGGSGAYGIGAGNRGGGGRLSSDHGGSAWIETDSIKDDTDMRDFRSGVIIIGNKGTVYGSPRMKTSGEIKRNETLNIDSGRRLIVGKGVTLTIARGATVSAEGGGGISNEGSIVSSGVVRLAASGTIADIKKLNMTGRGIVEMGGRKYNHWGGTAITDMNCVFQSDQPPFTETLAVMEGAGLEIHQGVKLTLLGDPPLVNYGKIVNKGTVVMPVSTDRKDIRKIGMTDDMANDIYGFVEVGGAEYTSDGGEVMRDSQPIRSTTGIRNGTWMLMPGASRSLYPYVFMMIKQGERLIVQDGASISTSRTSHGIRNDGIMRLPAGTDITKLKLAGKGIILMGGKIYDTKGKEVEVKLEVPKLTSSYENDAVTNAINKYVHTDSGTDSARGLRAADDEQDPLYDGMVKAQIGDILVYENGEDGELCTMKVDVRAQKGEFAVIANGQMGNIAYHEVEGGKIAYFARFVHPNDETDVIDVKFDEVPASEANKDELDKTLVIVNGRASKEVQEMPEYIPSGLVDGQGLVVCCYEYDEETKVYVLVIFDGSDDEEEDGSASAHIMAKQVTGGSGSGACGAGAGMAAILALAALAMKRRG